LFLTQCNEKERLIGKLKVNDIEGYYFRLYQYDEFDSATGLYCDLVNEKDSIIARKIHITGTLDYIDDLKPFSAKSYDSILYLTYINPEIIYSVYDLKSNWGYPQGEAGDDYKDKFRKADVLIENLKKHNKKLKASYKE